MAIWMNQELNKLKNLGAKIKLTLIITLEIEQEMKEDAHVSPP